MRSLLTEMLEEGYGYINGGCAVENVMNLANLVVYMALSREECLNEFM